MGIAMLSQEEYMDVAALHRQGWTITQIAAEIGRHPATVSTWLKKGGPPAARVAEVVLIDDRWAARIDELLARNGDLLATSILRLLEPEGFPASYPTPVRHLREKRGARKGRGKTASMPIETFPGDEAQADWSDCRRLGHAWGLGDLWCFGAIHCWCRRRFWWFAPSIDAAHTLEGFVRFFEDSDGASASSAGLRARVPLRWASPRAAPAPGCESCLLPPDTARPP